MEVAKLYGISKGRVSQIWNNWLNELIELYETGTPKKEIANGRNRFKACRELGIEPKFESYKGKEPLQFIISTNLHRRHLNDNQRSVVAEKISGHMSLSIRATRPRSC